MLATMVLTMLNRETERSEMCVAESLQSLCPHPLKPKQLLCRTR